MKLKLLFLCWEYEGFNTPQTAALVRRPRYFAESFFNDGYDVTVLFSCAESINETFTNAAGGSLRLISVTGVSHSVLANKWLNKLKTIYELVRYGDFSGKWNNEVLKKISAMQLQFDAVISFFTPRGPLYTAYSLKKNGFKFTSVFDFQDPYHEGLTGTMSRWVLKRGFRRIMRSADIVLCVNKEWSREITVDFGVQSLYLPHVIEERVDLKNELRVDASKKLVFFYSGSLEEDLQDPSLFFACLVKLKAAEFYEIIEFRYAGNQSKHQYFSKHIPQGISYTFLGWLTKEALYREINAADILCVFPITSQTYKTCIPSKFYEFCRFKKPVLIIGDDTGAFADEFDSDFDDRFVVRSVEQFMCRIQAFANGAEEIFFEADDNFNESFSLPVVYGKLKALIAC